MKTNQTTIQPATPAGFLCADFRTAYAYVNGQALRFKSA